MNNAERIGVYLRDRSTLTSAQQRRVNKRARQESDANRTARVGRIRRAFLRREARRLRLEGAALMGYVHRARSRRPRHPLDDLS